MKKLFLVLLLLSSNAFSGPLVCTSGCQYFDPFYNRCNYQTSCEYSDKCMTYTFCEKFDDFQNECVSEGKDIQCHTSNPQASAAGCKETCQFYDEFFNKCLYKTKCEIKGKCTTRTTCQHWDEFFKKCHAEQRVTQCN